ncbi:MAG: MrcB family domain-containing protein [Parvibaculaceae bacterium]
MRAEFQKIAAEFIAARAAPFSDHPLANHIRTDTPAALKKALGAKATALKIEGSPGKGNWAEVPWIALFNRVVTTTATKGYYLVYLFSADMTQLELSLNQGATGLKEIYGTSRAFEELKHGAELMRARLGDAAIGFVNGPISLRAIGSLGKSYEPGHAIGKTYDLANLPTDEVLTADLNALVELYQTVVFRGGTDPLDEPVTLSAGASKDAQKQEILEQRRYRYHRKIERNPNASKKAKEVHGYVCQSCGFDFEKIYGELGKSYIEAHHLKAIADLPENEAVTMNPETDFAVLCANCHRMIHRTEDPGKVSELDGIGRIDDLRAALKKLSA